MDNKNRRPHGSRGTARPTNHKKYITHLWHIARRYILLGSYFTSIAMIVLYCLLEESYLDSCFPLALIRAGYVVFFTIYNFDDRIFWMEV